jgi:nicotinamidase/pyrazinamidase
MHQPSFDPTDTAVIVVDLQADFTEERSGSLAVPGTDRQYLEAVTAATQELSARGFPLFFTQDWHPENHVSFYTNHPGKEPFQAIEIDGRSQILWPPHCVQGSPGAEIMIPVRPADRIVRKGADSRFDSYSGFADDGGHTTELDKLLKDKGIKQVMVYGLATDFCVKATAGDALENGYAVWLLIDLCRGVAPDSTEAAVARLRQRGITISRLENLI